MSVSISFIPSVSSHLNQLKGMLYLKGRTITWSRDVGIGSHLVRRVVTEPQRPRRAESVARCPQALRAALGGGPPSPSRPGAATPPGFSSRGPQDSARRACQSHSPARGRLLSPAAPQPHAPLPVPGPPCAASSGKQHVP